MTGRAAYQAMLDAFEGFCATRTDIAGFAGPMDARPVEQAVTPVHRAVAARLEQMCARAAPQTLPLVRAVVDAAPHMQWNSTYSAKDVGQDFLDHYGWFDLIGPSGPFRWDGPRVMIGFWDRGLDYQRHWHAPREAYIPLAGRASFWNPTDGNRSVGVGDIVIHGPNVPHTTQMDQGPFLALALWMGDDLSVRPIIESRTSGQPVQAAWAEP